MTLQHIGWIAFGLWAITFIVLAWRLVEIAERMDRTNQLLARIADRLAPEQPLPTAPQPRPAAPLHPDPDIAEHLRRKRAL